MKIKNIQEVTANEFSASIKMVAAWLKAAGFEDGAILTTSPEVIAALKSGEYVSGEKDGCSYMQSSKYDSDRKVWVLETEIEVSEELTLLGLDFLASPEVLEVVTFVTTTAKALKGLLGGVKSAFIRMGERAESLRK